MSLNPIPFVFAAGLAVWAFAFGGLEGVLWALGVYSLLIGGATGWVWWRRHRALLRDAAGPKPANGEEAVSEPQPTPAKHGLRASRRL